MESDNFPFQKERFAVLYASYARAYERFLENGFKTSTILLVILGWLLTSDKSRDYLGAHAWVAVVCAGLVVLGTISLWTTFHRLYRLSQTLRAKLDALSFIEPKFYDQHHIPTIIYLSVVGQNMLLCLLIASLILFTLK